MTKKISIAIDAMGGDNSPDKTIEGLKFFLEKNSSKNDFIYSKDLSTCVYRNDVSSSISVDGVFNHW